MIFLAASLEGENLSFFVSVLVATLAYFLAHLLGIFFNIGIEALDRMRLRDSADMQPGQLWPRNVGPSCPTFHDGRYAAVVS